MTTMNEQYQLGYDAARDELSVDQEYIDDLHEKIEELKKENEKVKNEYNDLLEWHELCVRK